MAEESFIPRAFHPQLQQVFDRFEQGVKVVTRYNDSALGKDLKRFSEELKALTELVSVSFEETDGIPAIELFFHDGRAAGNIILFLSGVASIRKI